MKNKKKFLGIIGLIVSLVGAIFYISEFISDYQAKLINKFEGMGEDNEPTNS
jgi:hypothetical protein